MQNKASSQLASTADWVDYYERAPGIEDAVDALIQELAWEPPGTNIESAIYEFVVDKAREEGIELTDNKLNEVRGNYIWNIWMCTEKGLS